MNADSAYKTGLDLKTKPNEPAGTSESNPILVEDRRLLSAIVVDQQLDRGEGELDEEDFALQLEEIRLLKMKKQLGKEKAASLG